MNVSWVLLFIAICFIECVCLGFSLGGGGGCNVLVVENLINVI